MHFPLSFCKNASPYFYGAFAPSFIWSRRPCVRSIKLSSEWSDVEWRRSNQRINGRANADCRLHAHWTRGGLIAIELDKPLYTANVIVAVSDDVDHSKVADAERRKQRRVFVRYRDNIHEVNDQWTGEWLKHDVRGKQSINQSNSSILNTDRRSVLHTV